MPFRLDAVADLGYFPEDLKVYARVRRGVL
jgi:hypothetical protein